MGKFFPILVLVLGSAYYFTTKDDYDPKSVASKRVLVTGASSGIGEELAYHYSELGAKLVLTARRAELLEQVAKRCLQLGAKQVSVIPADMAKPEDREKVVDHIRKQLHGLDHLILNHALVRAGPWQSSKENMTNLAGDMNVNFYSFVGMASSALPMLADSQGQIGVVSSLAGKIGSPQTSTYGATKFALQGFFTAWRQELTAKGTGVSVTLAVLGPVNTPAAVRAMRLVQPNTDLTGVASDCKDAAQAIVRAVVTRDPELHHGWLASVLLTVHKFAPGLLERYVGRSGVF